MHGPQARQGEFGRCSGLRRAGALGDSRRDVISRYPKNVAATVNGRAITFSELDRAIAAQFPNAPLKENADQTLQLRLEALRALIDSEILFQRAEKKACWHRTPTWTRNSMN